MSDDYIIQYDARATGCPNHKDTDRQDIWLLCPEDGMRWGFLEDKMNIENPLPAFYICFVCRRVFQLGAKGEVPNKTDSEAYERGAEAR